MNRMYFLTVSLLSSLYAVAQVEQPIHALLNERPAKALAALRELQSSDPSALNNYNLGYALLLTKNAAEAEQLFAKGIELDPKNPSNYIGKGRVLLLNGKFEEAKANFDKAIAFNKKDVHVINGVAEAYLTKPERVGQAESLLNDAVKQNIANSKTHELKGDAALVKNNGGEAISGYEKAVHLDSKNAEARRKMGQIYVRTNNMPLAIENYTQAVADDSLMTLVWKELASYYYLNKKGPEAVAAQKRYIYQTEDKKNGTLQMAFYQFLTRDFAKASYYFDEANKLGAVFNATALHYRAIAATENKEEAKAIEFFNAYFKMEDPKKISSNDYATYVLLLLRQSKDSLALDAINKSLSIDSSQSKLKGYKIEILYKMKRYEEAAQTYEKTMRGRPPKAQDYTFLGQCYYFLERYDKADEYFQKLVQIAPDEANSYLWEARTKASLDPDTKQGLAKEYYDKILTLENSSTEKGKKNMLEAYQYLTNYYYEAKNKPEVIKVCQKRLEIDPNDENAKAVLKALKTPSKPK